MSLPHFRRTNRSRHPASSLLALVREGNPASAPDTALIFVILGVVLFGMLMVYDSSLALALRDFSDKYYYVKEQGKWLVLGLAAFFTVSAVPYRIWKAAAFPMMAGVIALLVAVFIPGIGVKALGARRWVSLGFTVIQPAELAKLAIVVYLSAWMSARLRGNLRSFLGLMGVVTGLILIEPDMGTAMIVTAIALLSYFISGAPIKHFAILLPGLAAAALMLAVVSPYRFARLTAFINPEHDPLGSSYQIRQSIIALGSGGLTGVGMGKSRQKYEYLPEANTDAIFAIIGEEFGFLGSTVVILAYVVLVWRGWRIAGRIADPFGRMLAAGITGWIGVQAFMNIAATAALIPLTGIPLPLVSYGGSSLVVLLTGLGILVNISRYAN
jgi:cell division protein FtsW